MEKTIKKVFVGIYVERGLGDCTNGGLTSKILSAWMFIDCSRDEAVQYCKENNIDPDFQLLLVRRKLRWLDNADYVEPLTKPEGKWNMFGGNFVYTSDSRFREYTGSHLPLPVHDRYETKEEYDSLSV